MLVLICCCFPNKILDPSYGSVVLLYTYCNTLYNSSALLGPSLDKFEKIRIKVGLVLVAICDKTEYTN